MGSLKSHLKKMALTPKTQLKKLLYGTFIAFTLMLILLLTSNSLSSWQFYTLCFFIMLSILYAIPGYIGIWVWRMRKFFFDIN